MSVSSRRWAAFAGGCLVGIGLGALTSAVNSAANWYANYPDITNGTAAPTSAMWIACLIIGAGLGTALAAIQYIPQIITTWRLQETGSLDCANNGSSRFELISEPLCVPSTA